MEIGKILAQISPTMKVQLLDKQTIRLDINRLHMDLYGEEVHTFSELTSTAYEALTESEEEYVGPLATIGNRGLIEKKASSFIAIHYEGVSFTFCKHGFKELTELMYEASRNYEAFNSAQKRNLSIDEDIHTLLEEIEKSDI